MRRNRRRLLLKLPRITSVFFLTISLLLALSLFCLCLAEQREGYSFERLTFSSRYVGEAKCIVLLPPAYREREKEYYPVLYLLHGARADENAYPFEGNLIENITDLSKGIVTGKTLNGLGNEKLVKDFKERLERSGFADMIVVCPGGNTYFRNEYEKMLIYELIPLIEKKYRVRKEAKFRAIDGLCAGGNGAFRIALTHPELFGSFGAHDGDLFNYADRQQLQPALVSLFNRRGKSISDQKICITTMTDTIPHYREINLKWHEFLKNHKIEHEFYLLPGSHNMRYFGGPAAVALLLFHSDVFRKATGETWVEIMRRAEEAGRIKEREKTENQVLISSGNFRGGIATAPPGEYEELTVETFLEECLLQSPGGALLEVSQEKKYLSRAVVPSLEHTPELTENNITNAD